MKCLKSKFSKFVNKCWILLINDLQYIKIGQIQVILVMIHMYFDVISTNLYKMSKFLSKNTIRTFCVNRLKSQAKTKQKAKERDIQNPSPKKTLCFFFFNLSVARISVPIWHWLDEHAYLFAEHNLGLGRHPDLGIWRPILQPVLQRSRKLLQACYAHVSWAI